jgi:hypothetical protein
MMGNERIVVFVALYLENRIMKKENYDFHKSIILD